MKHFGYHTAAGGGRVAISLDGDVFRFEHISGFAPPPQALPAVLSECPGIVAAANTAALTRRNPYAVQRRVGMSGCVDYLLREQRDSSVANHPIRARLHVSMANKLNEPIKMWVGDLPPLLGALMADSPGDFRVWEEIIYQPDQGWTERPTLIRLDEDTREVSVRMPQPETESEWDAAAILARLQSIDDPVYADFAQADD